MKGSVIMRHASWIVLALVGLLLVPQTAFAQRPTRKFKIERKDVQVGYQSIAKGSDYGFKAGLWTPVTVRFSESEEGNVRLPVAEDGSLSGEIQVEVTDNDGVLNVYPQPFTLAAGEPLQVVTYTKMAGTYVELKISVKAGGQTYKVAGETFMGLDVGSHLYLALNDTLPSLTDALVVLANPNALNDVNASRETRPRFAVYENDPKNLPTLWFGYNSVDLAILASANDKFLDKMVKDRKSSPQLDALAEWVRRGGRLVVSVSPTHREKVFRLLDSPAWKPALPPILTADSKTYRLTLLDSEFRTWSQARDFPFHFKFKGGKEVTGLGVRLQRHPTLTVECWDQQETGERVPLIARFPHGLGSITLIGFDVKDQFLTEWAGRNQFWKQVVQRLAPKSDEIVLGKFGGGGGGGYYSNDLTSQLYTQMDKFDTPTISFGWVVLFIFLYILVVGPVDYLILKLLFKRLELTWLTFPAVVISISLLAYFTAYAIKGQDLKVNKIDLIDIDLRSSLKEDGTPASAKAYGTAWFSILSPRIQNYTIGLEPRLDLWQGIEAPAQPYEPTLSWLGRPEGGGMGASGRGRSTSLFSRTYSYAPNGTGLRDVPIPVWTIKSFTASWEAPLTKLPLEVKLSYEQGKAPTGTLKNNLPFALKECGLIYNNRYFSLPDLPPGVAVPVELNQFNANPKTVSEWINAGTAGGSAGAYDPTDVVRKIMFHELSDPHQHSGNHAHRNLDLSWRVDTIRDAAEDWRIREAILVCRVPGAKGPLNDLHVSNDLRLPTHLWLGELPGTPIPGKTRTVTRADGKTENVPALVPLPDMQGTLVQDTYIRVLLPVAPKKD